jgi:hypothetical protein
MWDWISCNLLGQHREVVTSDRSTIHLLCVRCGHRSTGWQLVDERRTALGTARLWPPRPVHQMAPRQPS